MIRLSKCHEGRPVAVICDGSRGESSRRQGLTGRRVRYAHRPLLRLCNGCQALAWRKGSTDTVRQSERVRLGCTCFGRGCLLPVEASAYLASNTEELGADLDGDYWGVSTSFHQVEALREARVNAVSFAYHRHRRLWTRSA